MEALYIVYRNVWTCMNNYRYYNTKEILLEYDDFVRQLTLTSYIKHVFNKDEKTIVLLFMAENSIYIKSTSDFNKLVDIYDRENHHVIIISKYHVRSIQKALNDKKNMMSNSYLYKNFLMEISKGPLCSKHSILNYDEVRKLWALTYTHPFNYPSITIEDPHVIWIGAEIGDMIKIEGHSEITGKYISYRIVSPVTGKIIQS